MKMSKKDRFKKKNRIDRLKSFPDTPFAGENVTDDEIYGILAEMKKHFSPEDGATLEEAIKQFKTGKTIEEKQKGFDKIVNFTSYVALKAHKHGMSDNELLKVTADISSVKNEGDKYIDFRREFDIEDTRVGTILLVAPADQYGVPIIVEFPGEFQIMTSVKDNLVSQGKTLQSGLTVEITGMVTGGVDVNINNKHYQLPYMKSSKICIK